MLNAEHLRLNANSRMFDFPFNLMLSALCVLRYAFRVKPYSSVLL